MINFDMQLMADTAEKMSAAARKDFASLADSHGVDFAASVMGNMATDIQVWILAAQADDEQRYALFLRLVTAMCINLKLELSGQQAEAIIAKAMGKPAP